MESLPASQKPDAPNTSLLMFTKGSIAVYTLSGAAIGWEAGYGTLHVVEHAAMEERSTLQDQISHLEQQAQTPDNVAKEQALTIAKEPYDHVAHEYTSGGASIGTAIGLAAMVTVLAARKIQGYRITPRDPSWMWKFGNRK